ncbi:MAG: twin-arginine translocase TatA/TatE family subunit [Nitrospinota bacterium]
MFPTIGFPELLVILAVCVLLFGAKRLPEIGSGLARGIKSFKQGLSDEPEKPEKPQVPGKTEGGSGQS